MAAHVYKCPNCNAELTFDPAKGDFGCAYCDSHFTKAELEKLDTAQKAEQKEQQDAAAQDKPSQGTEGELNTYSCPNCGAEIVADATTAATFCYYCHSPVILTGKLAGKYRPDAVIPFKVDRKRVEKELKDWCKKKRFLDKRFLSDAQTDKLTGVYFPFWLVDTKLHSDLTGTAEDANTWLVGDTEYTEHKEYAVSRSADLDINNVTVKALKKPEVNLLDGIYPYDTKDVQDFDMAYLSGFFAEKRDVEKESAAAEANATTEATAKEMMLSKTDCPGVLRNVNCQNTTLSQTWRYTLMPAWMMTYNYKGDMYYFAMNGQTGKIFGNVPVDKKKVNLMGLLIGVGAFILAALIRLFFM
ncbi:MAG: TFIIB-type zinc ribbon-containing protein [Clostridia bacterium]|nr:TFIIB-type zinc ribbon-containing protein [Clostridia bacterium]